MSENLTTDQTLVALHHKVKYLRRYREAFKDSGIEPKPGCVKELVGLASQCHESLGIWIENHGPCDHSVNTYLCAICGDREVHKRLGSLLATLKGDQEEGAGK